MHSTEGTAMTAADWHAYVRSAPSFAAGVDFSHMLAVQAEHDAD